MRIIARLAAISIVLTLALIYCAHVEDHPRLPSGVRVEDIHLHSEALGHNVTYRVILPNAYPPTARLPVVWLLHGAGDNYRSWSNRSDIAQLAQHGVVLVMPDGENSYYVDAASGSHRRYESYIIDEIIPDARRRFPAAATDREHNAVVGISRGGFGAVVLALKHPQLFSFVGGMSSALDAPERKFRWRDLSASLGIRRTFGPMGSATRKQDDPFLLAAAPGPGESPPYFYLTCGEQESLLGPNQRFAKLIQRRPIASTIETTTGSHNWNLWNRQLPGVEQSLLDHFGIIETPTSASNNAAVQP